MAQQKIAADQAQRDRPQISVADISYPDLANVPFTDDTDQFAELNLVKGQTVRKRHAVKGSYFGVRPLKLANGRLKWPHVIVTKRGVA